jgi:predicted Zn-ribbon and HTH transcriptional regulator|tara:strand:+ start:31 stop:231 length:201 start_codon:yes stop_codon:yes gene_type:complete
MPKKCPKCKSENIELVNYLDIKATKCNDCSYDERKQYEVYPEDKVSQKAKGKYTPYKTGGRGRTRK